MEGTEESQDPVMAKKNPKPLYAVVNLKTGEVVALGAARVVWKTQQALGGSAKGYGTSPVPQSQKVGEQVKPTYIGGKLQNPALMVISNPAKLKGKIGKPDPKAIRTYKSFHMSDPGEVRMVSVPKGWPKNLVVIGDVDRLDVGNERTGKETSKKYKRGQIKVCMTTSRRELFIVSMNGKKLGVPSGVAMRIDYTVPETSGRNKWAKRWWHPHDSGPKLKLERNGKAARVKGPKLKITKRGIIG